MSREFVYMMEDIMESGIVFSSVGPTLALVAYVFSALGIFTIAQRRQISRPWLAWIPVVNVWVLGSISDQYRYVVKGEVRSRRKVLLILSILNTVLSLASTVSVVMMVVSLITGSMQGMGNAALGRTVLEGILTCLVISLPFVILSVVQLVFEYMALYDLYTSCERANNVLYLVLSLIPGVNKITKPLFLFLCRNQDDGMPPRREAAAEELAEF